METFLKSELHHNPDLNILKTETGAYVLMAADRSQRFLHVSDRDFFRIHVKLYWHWSNQSLTKTPDIFYFE
jgi:hypothetical protein